MRNFKFFFFVHVKGDQASIIGGAIDFVKELEQVLESLKAQRKERKGEEGGECKGEQSSLGSPTSSSAMGMASNGRIGEGVCAELKSEVAEIEVTMIQTHVNLKIKCPKRQGQLLKAIVALEDLRLTVLHLNITTSQATATMLYSINLKVFFRFLFPLWGRKVNYYSALLLWSTSTSLTSELRHSL